LKIEFDSRKAAANLKKHGVSFEEAETALFDPLALSMEDSDAQGESRWLLVGMDSRMQMLTVIYTLRGNCIRIISARRSTKPEVRNYAQGI
jgi:uncharacterized DUF497 family protein